MFACNAMQVLLCRASRAAAGLEHHLLQSWSPTRSRVWR